MDSIPYCLLKLLYKHSKFPISHITDKRFYGSEHLNTEESEIDRERYKLLKAEYIQQYPIGFYRLTKLGEHEFKKERLRRIGAWWIRNYKWIIPAAAIIVTIVIAILTKKSTPG